MQSPFNPIKFPCGQTMKNRFMLAPMTNTQSHEDGSISEDELNWLTMRAKGGFGLTMTCASHVQANGKGFPGQLGIFSDIQNEGHRQLTKSIQAQNSLAVIQLHHAGIRSPKELVEGGPVGPSVHEKTNSRALTLAEVHRLRDDFIAAAIRAKNCGYNGVEVHGAHGYIISQFISDQYNFRNDEYGGSLENRIRLLLEIVDGIRQSCGTNFLLGVRLSPERFGMKLMEIKAICERLVDEGQIDFLDISLWDCFKQPEEEARQTLSLLEHFTSLNYKSVQLTVAGKIGTGEDVRNILLAGVDFVTIGKAAILHHDFPVQIQENPNFEPIALPVTSQYLSNEGLGKDFITYMSRWPGFVKQ